MILISVRMAENEDDIDAVRALCLEWLDWHWRHYPSDWPTGEDHPMEPQHFEAIVQDLPKLHSRPRGGILVGSVDGNAAGGVMYQEVAEDVAEFNRMFVSEKGRGHRLGQRMLERMFEQMISDGYRKVVFSSATFLTHARAMYKAAGFVDMPHPPGFPEEWRERVYFMERDLV